MFDSQVDGFKKSIGFGEEEATVQSREKPEADDAAERLRRKHIAQLSKSEESRNLLRNKYNLPAHTPKRTRKCSTCCIIA